MSREGIQIFYRSPRKLRENSGEEGKAFTFAVELKFVRFIFRFEDLRENRLHDELMWCLVVFQRDLHGQCLPQGKVKLLLKDSVSKGEVVYVRVHSLGIARGD